MAQSQGATITANASVISDIAVGADKQNIEFGKIIVGTSKYISAFYQSVTLQFGEGTTGGEQIGWFDISVTTGVNVDLALSVPTGLSDGTHSMAINFYSDPFALTGSLNGFVTADDPNSVTTANAVTGGESTEFTPNDELSPTEWSLDNPFEMPSGTVYMVLGGEINSGASQPAGSYTGNITLMATITD